MKLLDNIESYSMMGPLDVNIPMDMNLPAGLTTPTIGEGEAKADGDQLISPLGPPAAGEGGEPVEEGIRKRRKRNTVGLGKFI